MTYDFHEEMDPHPNPHQSEKLDPYLQISDPDLPKMMRISNTAKNSCNFRTTILHVTAATFLMSIQSRVFGAL
jgi:hypothetical protein